MYKNVYSCIYSTYDALSNNNEFNLKSPWHVWLYDKHFQLELCVGPVATKMSAGFFFVGKKDMSNIGHLGSPATMLITFMILVS